MGNGRDAPPVSARARPGSIRIDRGPRVMMIVPSDGVTADAKRKTNGSIGVMTVPRSTTAGKLDVTSRPSSTTFAIGKGITSG